MTLGEMAKHIRPGISTLELDRIAEEFIRSHGANPDSRATAVFRFEHATAVGNYSADILSTFGFVEKESGIQGDTQQ